MRVITRLSNAMVAADHWERQYSRGTYGTDKADILYKLRELGENPNPDDVDRIIGNSSWTRTECNECGRVNVDVVEIGQKPDYESYTANICKSCLSKALEIIS